MSTRNLNQTHKAIPASHRHPLSYPQPQHQKQKAKGQLILKQHYQSTIDQLRHQNDELRYRMVKTDLDHTNCINEIHEKYAQKEIRRREKVKSIKGRKDGEREENICEQDEFGDFQELIDRIRRVANYNGELEQRIPGFDDMNSRNNSREASTSRSTSRRNSNTNSLRASQQKNSNLYNSMKQSTSPYKQAVVSNFDPENLFQYQLRRKLYTFQTVKKIVQTYQSQKYQSYQHQKTQLHLLKQSYDEQISQLVSVSRLSQQKLLAQAQVKYKDYLNYIENLKEEHFQNLKSVTEEKRREVEKITVSLREELKGKVEKEYAEEVNRSQGRYENLIRELRNDKDLSKKEQQMEIEKMVAEKQLEIQALERITMEEKTKGQHKSKDLTEKQNQIIKQNHMIIFLKAEIESKCKELKQKDQIRKQQLQQFEKYKKEITDRVVKKIKKENQISQQRIKQIEQKYQKQLVKYQEKINQLQSINKRQLRTSELSNQQEMERLRKQAHHRQVAHQQSLLSITNLKQSQLRDIRALYQKRIVELNRKISELQKESISKNRVIHSNNHMDHRLSAVEQDLSRDLKNEREKKLRLETEIKQLRENYQQLIEEGKREMLDIGSIVEQMKRTIQSYQHDIALLGEELRAVKVELKAQRNKSQFLDQQFKQQQYLNKLKVLSGKTPPCGHQQEILTLKQENTLRDKQISENNLKIEEIQTQYENKITEISSKHKVQRHYLSERITMLQKQISSKQSQIQRQRLQFQTDFKKVFKITPVSKPLSPSKTNLAKQNSNTNSRIDKFDTELLLLRIKELQTNNLNYSERVKVLEDSNTILRRQLCTHMDEGNKEKELYETVNSLRAKLSSSEKREKLLRESPFSVGRNRSSRCSNSNGQVNENGNIDRNTSLHVRSTRERVSLNRSKEYQNCPKIIYNEIFDNIKQGGKPANSSETATVKAQRSYFKGVDKYTSDFDSPIKESVNNTPKNGSK